MGGTKQPAIRAAVAIVGLAIIGLTTGGCIGESPSAVPTPDGPVVLPRYESQASTSLSGVGQKVTESFHLEPGMAKFDMKHQGTGAFVVRLLDASGNEEQLLVDTTGSFDGTKSVFLAASGDFHLDITADGPWTVEIH